MDKHAVAHSSKKSMAAQEKDELAEWIAVLGKNGFRKSPGAKSLARLEKLAPVPDGLAALWRWSDGLKGGCFFDPKSEELDEDEGLYFLSVRQAETEMKYDVGPKEGLVFGSDAAGGLLVAVGTKGRVDFWEHETRKQTPLASSFSAFLKRSTRALKKRGAPSTTAPDATPLQATVRTRSPKRACAR